MSWYVVKYFLYAVGAFFLLMIFVITFSGCGKEQYHLSDGQTVSCLESSDQACGWTLSRCADGNVYTCQNNFTTN